ncbi:AsnC family transcriptional regulator [Tepidamorphus gemmatus]|jgi:Lrp/AsnC family leucine-responsive transcriptional regulator|uniref:AsnC family transcriptional regulator n=1 Tax=Tepidamorphus gemmatus TaxID=747076 RepID=A0A4R3MG04_9HYPH|nr:Lrp/AsnC family transcriptional regulator [Tepidamorphus gemmatus]TCT12521.1 AsnC family transcriptional regulator [Tepidamorphus gemmatus]
MIDAIDRRIIRELQADGRITNQALAERVGLSPSPCLRRLRRLEEAGVIRGYTALIDQEAYGLPINVFASVKLTRQTEDALAEFDAAVKRWDEVLDCFLMTGTRDYLLRIAVDSLEAYERFLRTRLTRLACVGSIESSFALGIVKTTPVLPLVAD